MFIPPQKPPPSSSTSHLKRISNAMFTIFNEMMMSTVYGRSPPQMDKSKKVRLFMKQNKLLVQNISFKVAPRYLFYRLMKATGHTKNYIGSLLVFILDMPCWIRVVANSLLHNVTRGTIRCMLLGLSCRQSWPRCHKKSQRLKVVFSHGAPCL